MIKTLANAAFVAFVAASCTPEPNVAPVPVADRLCAPIAPLPATMARVDSGALAARDLPSRLCDAIVTRAMADGSIGVSTSRTDVPAEYVVTFDCGYAGVEVDAFAGGDAGSSDASAGGGKPTHFARTYVGVVTRVQAVVDTLAPGLDIGTLDAIGAAIAEGRASGRFNFFLIGLNPTDASFGLPPSAAIDTSSIAKAKSYLDSIWALATDPHAVVEPQAFRGCKAPSAASPFEELQPAAQEIEGGASHERDAAPGSSDAGPPEDGAPRDGGGREGAALDGKHGKKGTTKAKDAG